MNNRQKETRRLTALPLYLKELSTLVGRIVHESELSPFTQMEIVREKLRSVSKGSCRSVTLPFEARTGVEFAQIIDQLRRLNSSSIYLWPSRANECGLLEVADLNQIKFSFPFDLNPDGILVVATSDGNDSMLLEWSDDERGVRMLEVEFRGPNWSKPQIEIEPRPKQ
ncbi:hypothetical protein [Prosthecobacter fluviatilis]|uniref:Uncharacterized protein n=1 Tax=Prosthecobacter fluviatilis TaxID=445931 RepID=A0ABW0KVM7_9BACT